MVLFSFRAPNADYLGFPTTSEAIVETACKAEEQGFDAVLVNDHIIMDGSSRSAYWKNCYDPLMVLSYLAACTSQIKLATSMLVMPYRNPIATAKMVATLDQMSGGRAIAGVGAGWSQAEYDALGVPYKERGARTNEYLELWKACWAPGETSFSGRYFSFEAMHVNPKPIQHPHPPIWIGGSSVASLHRAAKFAQTWQPSATPVMDLVKNKSILAESCAQIGRQDVPMTRMSFRINFVHITGGTNPGSGRPIGEGTPEQVATDIQNYKQEAGLEAFQINFNGCHSLQQLLDSMDLFTQEVRPRVEQ